MISGSVDFAHDTAALQNVQTMYSALPHASVAADLDLLAAQMVSSGAFHLANVNDGGISAVLADGQAVEVFADHLDDPSDSSPAATGQSQPSAVSSAASLSAPNQHEIAFLVNSSGDGSFHPTRQANFAQAFVASGFVAANGYGVDSVDITLDNIVAMGTGHSIDFLDIATHGDDAAVFSSDPKHTVVGFKYYMLSTTPWTAANVAKYQADFDAGRLVASFDIHKDGSGVVNPTIAFTPDFLTAYLRFNAGAIVDNESCYGQHVKVAESVQSSFKAAGVGRYLGWTLKVIGNLADGSDAFLFDRLLGEQSPSQTHLDVYAPQKTPPQRPLSLDDIQTGMGSEFRSGGLWNAGWPNQTYLQSTQDNSLPANFISTLVVSDFGGENVAEPPIVYGLPSIDHTDLTSGGVLTIFGNFPKTVGTIQVTDGSDVHKWVPTSWTATRLTVTLPTSGTGSQGDVRVLSREGIGGNSSPISCTRSAALRPLASQGCPIISVTPGTSTILDGANVTLTANISRPFPSITYLWSLSSTTGGAVGRISPLATNSLATSATVQYTAPSSGTGTDRVSAQLFDNSSGSSVLLGSGSADVSYTVHNTTLSSCGQPATFAYIASYSPCSVTFPGTPPFPSDPTLTVNVTSTVDLNNNPIGPWHEMWFNRFDVVIYDSAGNVANSPTTFTVPVPNNCGNGVRPFSYSYGLSLVTVRANQVETWYFGDLQVNCPL
ncbi:MAG TPA: hypothetical protein VFW34_02600 [Candidatus Rubrimentiphilum sp.]|nr:hypothetical protein [Candidatus Rubrimentiphilum sp.]